ncbi:MAG TPA: hypothetical protein VFX92_00805 [Candidatus Krumholzibacteria bacterium]|nr:hypothetical protein [Candidatus Krumholzibacteria bacterium]
MTTRQTGVMNHRTRRMAASVALFAMCAWALLTPYVACAGTASDDLKQIEYRYYFRGKYQQTIESLQTFLARVDLSPAETLRAREVLAASYVLGGAPAMGKEVFARIITTDPAYPGPDPGVFKLEVVNVYAEARSEYAAMTLKTVPAQVAADTSSTSTVPAGPVVSGKPIYKKWWFYAGAATLLAVAGVAASGGSDASNPAASGSVNVGVRLP